MGRDANKGKEKRFGVPRSARPATVNSSVIMNEGPIDEAAGEDGTKSRSREKENWAVKSEGRSRSEMSKAADVSPADPPLKQQAVLYLDLGGAGSSSKKETKKERLHVSKENPLEGMSSLPRVEHVADVKKGSVSRSARMSQYDESATPCRKSSQSGS